MMNKIDKHGRINTQRNKQNQKKMKLFNQLAMETLFGMKVGSKGWKESRVAMISLSVAG
jgi:hypothetical protein